MINSFHSVEFWQRRSRRREWTRTKLLSGTFVKAFRPGSPISISKVYSWFSVLWTSMVRRSGPATSLVCWIFASRECSILGSVFQQFRKCLNTDPTEIMNCICKNMSALPAFGRCENIEHSFERFCPARAISRSTSLVRLFGRQFVEQQTQVSAISKIRAWETSARVDQIHPVLHGNLRVLRPIRKSKFKSITTLPRHDCTFSVLY